MLRRNNFHFVHVFPSFDPGGSQVRTSLLINTLLRGFKHTIIAMDGRLGCKSRISPSVDVKYISLSLKGRKFALKALKDLLATLKPDFLLTYNWGAIEAIPAGRLVGTRACIHIEDGFGPDEARRFKKRRVWARWIILRLADSLVVPSLTLLRVAKDVWHIPDSLIWHIPNGVATDKFTPKRNMELRRRLGIKDSDCVFGVVAQLRPEKNLSMLIRLFAQALKGRPAYLMIVGDGPEKERLKRTAEKLSIKNKVIFTGHVEDTAPYYQTMDVFALSSVTEQMPLTLLEAMSSGLPVISTDVGDIKQMVCDENKSFIFSISDEQKYERGLVNLFEKESLRRILGKQNREKVIREYSLSRMIQRYEKLFEKYLP